MATQLNLHETRSDVAASATADDAKQKDIHEYEQVLQLIGFGRTQWVVLFTCGFLLMLVINETMGMNIITIASQCDFGTTSVQKAVMSAACFIGILTSSYFWGYLSDTIGRRQILIYSTLISNAVSFISMFIPNLWVFVFLRFIVGVFLAGASSTTYAYVGEFVTNRQRPVVINYASTFVGISSAYVPAVAWLVLKMNWSWHISDSFAFRPWRLLILFNILPGFLATMVLITLRESPKLLLSLRKDEQAFAVVDWISMRNRNKHLNDMQVYQLKPEPKMTDENILYKKNVCSIMSKMWRDTSPLFKRPYVLNFLISCTVMFGLFFSSSGMGLWYPEIQHRVGSNEASEQLTICKVIDASMNQTMENDNTTTICVDAINSKTFIDSITYGLMFTIGYIVLGVVLNPIGRKNVIIASLCISGTCAILLQWLVNPVATVVCFCFYLLLPGLIVSVLSGAVVDLVPTHLRGKAVCLCLMMGRGGAVIGSNLVGALLESYCVVTFGVFAGFVLICAALTIALPI